MRNSLLPAIIVLALLSCKATALPPAPTIEEHRVTAAWLTPTGTLTASSTPFPQPSSEIKGPTASATSPQSVPKMLAQVDRDSVTKDLQVLTGEEPACIGNGCHTISSRLTGSKQLDWAKEYVVDELRRLGYAVELLDWSRSGRADQNVIATKPGTSQPDEEIYFVAHLDGVKTVWQSKFPAADDNASGVADLLQVARILSGYSFNRTVVLFFSTGEEQGTLGVKSYLDRLVPVELGKIKYVINLDMLGYDANHDWSMELWYGGHAESLALAELMSDTIKEHQFRLVPEFVVGCG